MESVTSTHSDYRERIARDVGSQRAEPQYQQYSGVYFFLSLDLVNSTAYKANHPDWKYRIRMFYDEAENFWRNHQTGLRPRVWKYLGDEVLFYARIHSVDELQAAVEASYRGLRTVCSTVQTWTDKELFVKGTCWAAYAEYHKPAPASDLPSDDNSPNRNIVFQSPLGSTVGLTVLDFLGPEIDAGFRIASGSIKNALVVSAEVADVLWRDGPRNHRDRFRVVDFRELKGVWRGRHYPLVWYRDDWREAALDQDYAYDDEFKHHVLATAKRANTSSVDKLESILEQVHQNWLDLPKSAEKVASTESAPPTATIAESSTEVHCVAVCFNDDGKVLVAQRAESKRAFPGQWEAGCAQLRSGEDFYDAMERDYFSDFKLRLDFTGFRHVGAIGSYSFSKNGCVVPGVIFVARAVNPTDLNAAKHKAAQWIDPAVLGAEIGSNCVPGLRERIERALEVWKQVRRPSPPSP